MPPPPLSPNHAAYVTNVAIIGSGLAGLTTAYLLARDPRIHVEVFELASSPSLDSASITLKDATDGSLHRVDLPMRSFAAGYYKNLGKLYDHLHVAYRQQRFLFNFANHGDKASEEGGNCTSPPHTIEKLGRRPSVRSEKDPQWKYGHGVGDGDGDGIYFHHPSNLTYIPPRPQGTSLVPHVARCLYLLVCYLWFTICVFAMPPGQSDDLSQYLKRSRIPTAFRDRYLLPLLSAVSTCSHQTLLAAPAADVVSYKKLTHRKPHLSVLGGVSEAQARLMEACDRTGRVRFWFGRRVCSVRPGDDGRVWVDWRSGEEEDGKVKGNESVNSKRFDKVVLATPPDVVGRIYERLRVDMTDIPAVQVTSLVVQPPTTEMDRFSVVKSEVLAAGNGWVGEKMGRNGRGLDEEIITLRTDFRSGNTEAAHQIPCGAMVVTCPVAESMYWPGVLHKATFTRVLRTTCSRRVINRLFKPRANPEWDQEDPDMMSRVGLMGGDEAMDRYLWHNGDDGVYLVGGWCWDGMVLLEGCVVSALRVAREFGVDLPWECE